MKFALHPGLSSVVLADEDWQLVPSPSTLSRANLQVDIAYMLVLRKEYQSTKHIKRFRFLKIDSSPQAGKDWLLSEVRSLTLEQMQKLNIVFHTLATFEQDSEEHMDASQDVVKRRNQKRRMLPKSNSLFAARCCKTPK